MHLCCSEVLDAFELGDDGFVHAFYYKFFLFLVEEKESDSYPDEEYEEEGDEGFHDWCCKSLKGGKGVTDYPMNGRLIHRKTTRSLNMIYIPSPRSRIKKIMLIYPSMMKYFSFGSLKMDWIRTPRILPPSNAGIGRRLKIPKAREMSAAKAKNCSPLPVSIRVSPNFTAPTGQENLLKVSLIFLPLKEKRLFPSLPSALMVLSVCTRISFAATSIAVPRPNLMSFTSMPLYWLAMSTPRRQSLSGQVIIAFLVSLLCLKVTSNSLLMYDFSVLLILIVEIFAPSI